MTSRRGSYDACCCRRLRVLFKAYGRRKHGRWLFALDYRMFMLRVVDDQRGGSWYGRFAAP